MLAGAGVTAATITNCYHSYNYNPVCSARATRGSGEAGSTELARLSLPSIGRGPCPEHRAWAVPCVVPCGPCLDSRCRVFACVVVRRVVVSCGVLCYLLVSRVAAPCVARANLRCKVASVLRGSLPDNVWIYVNECKGIHYVRHQGQSCASCTVHYVTNTV